MKVASCRSFGAWNVEVASGFLENLSNPVVFWDSKIFWTFVGSYIIIIIIIICFNSPTQAGPSLFLRFIGHMQWRITVGRTPLDEKSARRRDLYMTTHNTYKG